MVTPLITFFMIFKYLHSLYWEKLILLILFTPLIFQVLIADIQSIKIESWIDYSLKTFNLFTYNIIILKPKIIKAEF